MDIDDNNYPDVCADKMNAAIYMHWSGEVAYWGLYGLCQQSVMALSGLADFWRLSALRLRSNASRMLNFHASRGALLRADSVQPLVDIPSSISFHQVHELCQMALNIELDIDHQLRSICETAKNNGDPETETFVAACFLHRQTRAIKYLRDHQTALRHTRDPILYDRLVIRALVDRMSEQIAVKNVALIAKAGQLKGTGLTEGELVNRILLKRGDEEKRMSANTDVNRSVR